MTLVAAWLVGTAALATAAAAAEPHRTPGAERGAKSAAASTPAASATPAPDAHHEAIIDVLSEIRVYQTLAKVDRPSFDKLVDRIASAPQSAATRATLLAVAENELIPLTRGFLAHANDETTVLYARNISSQVRIIARELGLACFAFVGPDPAAAVLAAGLDRGTFDHDLLELIADAIQTSATKPQPVPKAEEIKGLLDQVMPALEHRFGADLAILDHTADPAIDKAKACQATVSVYSTVLYRLPNWPDAGKVLRYLFAKQSG